MRKTIKTEFRTPEAVKNIIYQTFSEFGCVRSKAAINYAKSLVIGSSLYPMEIRKNKAEAAAMSAVYGLKKEGFIRDERYVGESILVPLTNKAPSFLDLDAFESFSAVTSEMAINDLQPQLCYPAKANGYPFHYVFSGGKDRTIYRILVYDQDALARIGYLNEIYNEKTDKKMVTLLVISGSYPVDEFKDIYIKGKARIAYVQAASKKYKTYKCTLTDVFSEALWQ